MTTTHTPTCRKCGAPFKASPAGTTVHCPACRGTRSAVAKAAATRTVTTCFCGKTVVAVGGHPTGVTCPRACGR